VTEAPFRAAPARYAPDVQLQTTTNLIETPVAALDIGMFVAQLDRPWLETPFALQGFHVRSRTDVDALSEYCRYVWVDPERRVRGAHSLHAVAPQRRRARVAKDTVSLKHEFQAARVDLESAQSAVSSVFERLRAGGLLDIAAMSKAIGPLVDSVLRNKDALAALIRMRRKDDYTYSHCLAVSVWSTLLGRHLALDKESLKELALGAALIDVGKARVEEELLTKAASLDASELASVREHLTHSIEIVEEANVDRAVIEIVRYHHERHDGSGYAEGIAGTAIPLHARIAGLADSYDAMISPRPYKQARSSFEAMQELVDLKDVSYQGELVEQFMQSIGLFPTGSIVELNSGEVGIVVAQNPSRRLKPKVMLVLDGDKQRSDTFAIIDLMVARDGNPVWITREHPPGTFGIDAEEFYL
jgi:HD-GYP domain-containing protein (c-di-GMP phosphodiesterase class II)